jgi:hypothetical protein
LESFNLANAKAVPLRSGVYQLYKRDWLSGDIELVYIGNGSGAEGVRGRLLDHLEAIDGTQGATHFTWSSALTETADQMEARELAAFEARYGCLPLYNEVGPMALSGRTTRS